MAPIEESAGEEGDLVLEVFMVKMVKVKDEVLVVRRLEAASGSRVFGL